jgi:uridylate kinase
MVPDEIDSAYLRQFKDLIEKYVSQEWKFIIITGGGRTCRKYQQAALEVDDTMTDEDRDWIGIHSTRLNAHLMRTIFRKIACPKINTNPHHVQDFFECDRPIFIAAGWKPGWSTDYDAAILAKHLDISKLVNFTNIDYAYTKDPNKYEDAEKVEKIDWKDFRNIVGSTWEPGLNAPFDPIASKLAEEIGLEVAIMNGRDLENFENYLKGEEYIGTTIK